MNGQADNRMLRIAAGAAVIEGMLELPACPGGIVVFAHGSGSSRFSPRNNFVAAALRQAGLGTLLLDLLTPEEDTVRTRRFDIPLLTSRLVAAVHQLSRDPATAALPLGVFGASTGAAAALQLAAAEPARVVAVVSRGGRPDLAGDDALARVRAPTLLIVGGFDTEVLALNRDALRRLTCPKELAVVPGATHLFDEAGTLEEVAALATAWFGRHLPAAAKP